MNPEQLAELVFKVGFAPFLKPEGVTAIGAACDANADDLVQHHTTEPAAMVGDDRPGAKCCGACAVSYAGWKLVGLETVSEVEQYFADACVAADTRLGEMSACRHFLNWFDENPRHEVLPTLSRWCRELLADWDGQTTPAYSAA